MRIWDFNVGGVCTITPSWFHCRKDGALTAKFFMLVNVSYLSIWFLGVVTWLQELVLKDEAHKVVEFGVLSVGVYKTSIDPHNFVRCVQNLSNFLFVFVYTPFSPKVWTLEFVYVVHIMLNFFFLCSPFNYECKCVCGVCVRFWVQFVLCIMWLFACALGSFWKKPWVITKSHLT